MVAYSYIKKYYKEFVKDCAYNNHYILLNIIKFFKNILDKICYSCLILTGL